MVRPMTDDAIRTEIEALEQEERRLRRDEEQAAAAERDDVVEADARRLKEIRGRLAQLWDLLHQRKALRASGGNPEDASLRSPGEIEGYLG